ncbi:MAG: hypothetical protein GXO45_00020 [Aquificae bacterium]|nr:hypothetical protein [Aquificota bacterium]
MDRKEALIKAFEEANENLNREIAYYVKLSKHFQVILLSGLIGVSVFLWFVLYALENGFSEGLVSLLKILFLLISIILMYLSVSFWVINRASLFWQEYWRSVLRDIRRSLLEEDVFIGEAFHPFEIPYMETVNFVVSSMLVVVFIFLYSASLFILVSSSVDFKMLTIFSLIATVVNFVFFLFFIVVFRGSEEEGRRFRYFIYAFAFIVMVLVYMFDTSLFLPQSVSGLLIPIFNGLVILGLASLVDDTCPCPL